MVAKEFTGAGSRSARDTSKWERLGCGSWRISWTGLAAERIRTTRKVVPGLCYTCLQVGPSIHWGARVSL
jgi:hypothetical protein